MMSLTNEQRRQAVRELWALAYKLQLADGFRLLDVYERTTREAEQPADGRDLKPCTSSRNMGCGSLAQSETFETSAESGSYTSSSVNAFCSQIQLRSFTSEHELPSKGERLEFFRVLTGGCL
jgi:hypothetical protein